MAEQQQTTPDFSSRGSEGHSEADGLREEYFGESGSIPVRRSERLQHNTPEVTGSEPLPPNWLDSVWVKEEKGRPMRVWYIKRGDQ